MRRKDIVLNLWNKVFELPINVIPLDDELLYRKKESKGRDGA